jgi:hypothetical protein
MERREKVERENRKINVSTDGHNSFHSVSDPARHTAFPDRKAWARACGGAGLDPGRRRFTPVDVVCQKHSHKRHHYKIHPQASQALLLRS